MKSIILKTLVISTTNIDIALRKKAEKDADANVQSALPMPALTTTSIGIHVFLDGESGRRTQRSFGADGTKY
jgi:hypothetical protein